MKDNNPSIDLFHRLLQAESENSPLFSILRELTQINSTRKIAEKPPQPLGSWSGWGY